MTAPDRTPRAATRARRRTLLAHLSPTDPVEIPALAERLGISESTVRRDLAGLERDGQVLRVLGGAVAKGGDPSWRQKERTNAEAKRRIAVRAGELVAPGSVVLLDAGTSVAAVAQVLAARAGLTLATFGLPSLENAADGAADVLVIGGRLHQRGGRFVGAWTHLLLDSLSPDIAFVGADMFDVARGINCPDAELAGLKSRAIEVSDQVWVLLDRSKLTAPRRHRFWAPTPQTLGLIVESPVTEPERQAVDAFRAAGHTVVVA
ncbi:DeoR/GlpR family DNA-binding transcription regulator [Xylanimonas ulmi]|uniref:Lactose phosphotransferase system repressor n=1 Tax=Xylanimonas ulmi TaxID=228973 RepID=A0A4Q7M778_9MICO|nr:DeoR/GlpR family DNA-binding transcription regulator [Xylanibacterium ulmi]RZS62953.1 DeoR family transcriptional regulator [Xylanibacterium ulmi]